MPATHTVYTIWRTRADHTNGEERSMSVWFENLQDANTCFDSMCKATNVMHVMLLGTLIGRCRESIRQRDGTMKETPRHVH